MANWKGFEKSDGNLIEVIFWNLLGGSEENLNQNSWGPGRDTSEDLQRAITPNHPVG
jgi:hypothetical protein